MDDRAVGSARNKGVPTAVLFDGLTLSEEQPALLVKTPTTMAEVTAVSVWWRLGRGLLIEQAALADGCFLDSPSLLEDGGCAAEVSVGGRDVAEALVDAAVVVVIDEVADGGFERAGQVMVFKQDPVLQRLVPAFDLALRLRMVRRAADVFHALAAEPDGEVTGDVGGAIVAEQSRQVNDRRLIAARGI